MIKYVFKSPLKRAIMMLLDISGGIFLFWLKMLKKRSPAKRILVLRLDQIGDMVQVLPFFSALRRKYPEHEIHALCVRDCGFLLESNPDIDFVHKAEASWFYSERKKRYSSVLRFARHMRKLNFEMAFDLRGDLRDLIFLKMCNAGRITGYGCAGGAFLIDDMPMYDRSEHEMDKNLKLIGEKAQNIIRLDFKVKELDEKRAVDTAAWAHGKRIAIVHPFTRAASKMWGEDKFTAIIKKLMEHGFAAILIGGPDDCAASERIAGATGAINAVGKLSLGGTIALIKKASLFVGNDSGPQYFAAYSGIKTCVIYGYTVDNTRWKPKVSPADFAGITVPVECGPCESSVCLNKKGHKCMDLITVEMVWDNILKLI